MVKPCDGKQLVAMLSEELNCHDIDQLAKKLKIREAQIKSWEVSESLSKTVVKNVIAAVRNAAVRDSIVPIMELRQLNHNHGHANDTLMKKIDSKKNCGRLGKARGVYSFYDSNGRIIYVGKTERTNLMAEMTQAFKLDRPSYTRKLADNNGKFSTHAMTIRDTAEFVSAYEVDAHAIGNVEAFLTRVIPNDVVNKKTENFS